MNAPVSVVIPCYNCKNTITRAIESINNQTLKPFEVILVDDCSQDSTLDILNGLKNNYPDIRIKVISLSKNKGPGSARNKGWDIASQEYIAFLDSDDTWHPSKINIQYTWMSNHKNAIMTAHSSRVYESDYELEKDNTGFKKVSNLQMLFSNKIPCRSVMIKRIINLRFLDNKRYAEDYLLWVRIIYKYQNIFFINQNLSFSHKSTFSDKGLTGQIYNMHDGVLHTYKELYYEKIISFPVLLFLNFISHLKLCFRLLKKYRAG
jgi:glycosyltransferase involved in cell wall biosynthesis